MFTDGERFVNNRDGKITSPTVKLEKMDRMSDIHKQRVKEQAEACLRQLRCIPWREAMPCMEKLLSELYMLREVHYSERDYDRGDSCQSED